MAFDGKICSISQKTIAILIIQHTNQLPQPLSHLYALSPYCNGNQFGNHTVTFLSIPCAVISTLTLSAAHSCISPKQTSQRKITNARSTDIIELICIDCSTKEPFFSFWCDHSYGMSYCEGYSELWELSSGHYHCISTLSVLLFFQVLMPPNHSQSLK